MVNAGQKCLEIEHFLHFRNVETVFFYMIFKTKLDETVATNVSLRPEVDGRVFRELRLRLEVWLSQAWTFDNRKIITNRVRLDLHTRLHWVRVVVDGRNTVNTIVQEFKTLETRPRHDERVYSVKFFSCEEARLIGERLYVHTVHSGKNCT